MRTFHACCLLVCLTPPAAAAAQDAEQKAPARERVRVEAPETDRPSFKDRSMDAYRALRSLGIYPRLGSVVQGSSLAAAVEVRRDRLFGIPVGASVEGAWSLRGYQQYDLRVGRIRGNDDRAELRPIDSDLTSTFNDGALLAPGWSYYLHQRWRRYPRRDFYGLGLDTDALDRTDYSATGPSLDAVVQWQRNRHFGVSARYGTFDLSIRPGTNASVPDTTARFSALLAPGIDIQRQYQVAGAGVTLDFRDRARLASRGTFAGIAIWHATPGDNDAGGAGGFTRLSFDVRHFIAIPDPDHVLALRLVASTRLGTSDVPMPFYLQPTIGGGRTMRGFATHRLRGEAAWAATAEYRWHVQKWIEVAPFVDFGAVADRFGRLGTTGVAATPGIGLRLRSESKVLVRVDYARSRDGNHVVFTLGSPF